MTSGTGWKMTNGLFWLMNQKRESFKNTRYVAGVKRLIASDDRIGPISRYDRSGILCRENGDRWKRRTVVRREDQWEALFQSAWRPNAVRPAPARLAPSSTARCISRAALDRPDSGRRRITVERLARDSALPCLPPYITYQYTQRSIARRTLNILFNKWINYSRVRARMRDDRRAFARKLSPAIRYICISNGHDSDGMIGPSKTTLSHHYSGYELDRQQVCRNAIF